MKLTNSHIRQLIAEERKRVVNEVPYSGRREDIPKTPPQPKKKKWSTPDAVDTTTPDTEFWHASPTKDLHYIRTIRINNREIEASAALDPMKREWGLTLNTPRGNPRNPIASAIISREIRTVEDIVRELEKGRPHAPSNLKSYEELWDRIYGRPVNEETMTKQQLKQIIKEEIEKIIEVGGTWGHERYDPNEPSNTPGAIAKDEFVTELMGEVDTLINQMIPDKKQRRYMHVEIEEKIVDTLMGKTVWSDAHSNKWRPRLMEMALGMIEKTIQGAPSN
jgi:hypothetical protein